MKTKLQPPQNEQHPPIFREVLFFQQLLEVVQVKPVERGSILFHTLEVVENCGQSSFIFLRCTLFEDFIKTVEVFKGDGDNSVRVEELVNLSCA